ncbi:MAG: hypothetical protein GQ569_05000 [Methylococcaceae bacterium]|nr:hypothetical protein [Methylococcaceae bacterium]
MPAFIISVLIQIALVVHITKTGRNTTWVYIVVFLPLAGSIAYFLVELLPELMNSRSGREVRQNIEEKVNPDKALKIASHNYSILESVENANKLAAACLDKDMFDEAKLLYEKSLKGIHENDPYLMYGLARAEFGLENYSVVKRLLDELIEKNPDFKNAEAHLLYARTLEALGDVELALQEYKSLDGYYSGAEASYRYAMLLKAQGNYEQTMVVLEKILHTAKTSGKHYNSLHKKWITLVKYEYHQ